MMTQASHRPKQPELFRARLLAVALDLLADQGMDAVTLDAVAQRAEVSKGGLQYHFRSKQALFDGMSDLLVQEFWSHYEDVLQQTPAQTARHARVYIRCCFAEVDPRRQKAIGLLALNWPSCRTRWRERMHAMLAEDGADAVASDLLFVCRLAAEGFWFGRMLEAYDVSEAHADALCARILALCESAA